ncbi:c-di-GMP-related signal transduction protein [Variovorax sp. TBS-050B]|uniref:EAL and HDOD domain-containing protein n=1 Tax=Variovorax sp. TBS-050B TaxID=2940551 RepID=UPI0024767490|nr:HDOD domain-containing protein [Variovorax sp. TBS-050B]MDH6591084.1 c-di-GMP-related signal transduction protein [Variovorax sp. TBS-050B]
MRFDFFRRSGAEKAAGAMGSDGPAFARNADGYVAYTLLLDPQKRVVGYKLAWRPAVPEAQAPDAITRFKALLACVTEHLSPPHSPWKLGRSELFFDVDAEALALGALQSLPPEYTVFCLGLDDLANEELRPVLLFLREQGFSFMLCRAQALPEDPELRGLITHFDVGAGDPALVAAIRGCEQPCHMPIHPIATRMNAWADFDACAAQRIDVFAEARCGFPTPAVQAGNHALQPESMLIVRLLQMLQRNEDLREVEATLKRDAALTYRLLRHMNSPAVGAGVEIHSLHHAVTMLGYSPLFRWLSMLLATSNAAVSPPFMMKKAIMRGRFVELMGEIMLPPGEADNLFVVGMFSLIDQLLGVPMREVLAKVQLPASVQQAILAREGVYGPFLALAEACELDTGDAARLAESLLLGAEQVNAAHLCAVAWSHDVTLTEAA